ncbi:MAG: LysM peptidoglycan-binding domain-containing protein [Gammaproteobacteria bacterium]|nr:LysM peptidoglycan-binding domain-containing protein [Gammaproteobacteria bacterium]
MTAKFPKRAFGMFSAIGLLLTLSGCATQAPQKTVAPPPKPTFAPKLEFKADPKPVILRESRPQLYVVVKGDTLWDIAAHFLRDPWIWPEIWEVNPQIQNPHLIYPGDRISVSLIDGQPHLYLDRPGMTGRPLTLPRGTPIVRLSPQIREQALETAIPMISANAIRQFTVQPRIVGKNELANAPYILGNQEGRLLSATGNQLYARGLKSNDESLFSIFRPGNTFIDPDSDEILGYEAIFIADAKVTQFGDPATLTITNSTRETLGGDRLLMQKKGTLQHSYLPHVPKQPINAQIISLFDAISQVAQNQVVVLNKGQQDGLEVGHILAIKKRGEMIKDRFSGKHNDYVQLPDSTAGVLMIFRSFDRLSYGLIMEATRAIHINDRVTNP